MNRPEPRGGIGAIFQDPTKRGVLLTAAVVVNLVVAFLNLIHVFDRAPAWAGVVLWVVEVVVGLVLIGVLVHLVRDWRQRRRVK